MQYETMLKLWKRIFDTWGNLEIIQWLQNKTSTYKRRDMHICIHMGKTDRFVFVTVYQLQKQS